MPVLLITLGGRNVIEIQSSNGVTGTVQASVGLSQDFLNDGNNDPEVDMGASADDTFYIVDFDATAARPRLLVVGGSGIQQNNGPQVAALT